jgi:membrane protease YdiL (CAAX protease family)
MTLPPADHEEDRDHRAGPTHACKSHRVPEGLSTQKAPIGAPGCAFGCVVASFGAMLRWGRVAGAYLLLTAVAFVAARLWHGSSPFVHPEPWLGMKPRASHTYSVLVGTAFGALVVMLTRLSVERFGWARSLHAALRPVARGMSTPLIAGIAVLSALGEELLFRGLLMPSIGLLPQAILFGVVHQVPGRSRWVWVGWATVVGLALGALFQLTGSLAGAIVAHALVNGMNLAFLRAHDPSERRTLGGLLSQQ